ncbi:nucleotidyltransferase-like protein [Paenibacillus sp. IHBB 10380]|uniref:nucleotidyltransferase-like protein n=1 Tax=Paenibacillus sp. IHBB 10380 TaxID=1566358 RepID=UPI0005CFA227|nr:nucleotidyltransferase-like protein [Paenibacillus sp. IHBB 10380]
MEQPDLFFKREIFDESTIGSIAYHEIRYRDHGALLYDFEYQILVVHEPRARYSKVEHTIIQDSRCEILHTNLVELRKWLIAGDKEDVVKYLLEGDILLDNEGDLLKLRLEFQSFEQQLRDQMMFLEFSRFLWLYVEAKRYMEEHRIMDAYHSVMESLHHWARIELIERGILPRSYVWEQVRGLNSAVHKLYEELTVSKETVEQRIELVLLGCEFSVMSKMAQCSVLLLRILSGRIQAWSIEDLIHHPELMSVSTELPLVLRKLVYHSFVKEVIVRNSNIRGNQNILYQAKIE